jgi:hypothetical protein
MLNPKQFGKLGSPAIPNPQKVGMSSKVIKPKLPKFVTPEEKALDSAKTRRLNAAAYKDRELGRLAYLESVKMARQKVGENPKKPTKK